MRWVYVYWLERGRNVIEGIVWDGGGVRFCRGVGVKGGSNFRKSSVVCSVRIYRLKLMSNYRSSVEFRE